MVRTRHGVRRRSSGPLRRYRTRTPRERESDSRSPRSQRRVRRCYRRCNLVNWFGPRPLICDRWSVHGSISGPPDASVPVCTRISARTCISAGTRVSIPARTPVSHWPARTWNSARRSRHRSVRARGAEIVRRRCIPPCHSQFLDRVWRGIPRILGARDNRLCSRDKQDRWNWYRGFIV
jgi:hypothetical protein